jgi:hypothetical protein
MRPTIPLADYRLSIDLDGTRDLGRADAGEAVGCRCAWCENWRGALSASVPDSLVTQLRRVGVDPHAPSDLYAYASEDEGHLVRVQFYVVGAIQSGPPANIDLTLGDGSQVVGRRYAAVRQTPSWIGLTVAPPLGGRPRWAPSHVGPVLEVDFRLYVPWVAVGAAPPTHVNAATAGKVSASAS